MFNKAPEGMGFIFFIFSPLLFIIFPLHIYFAYQPGQGTFFELILGFGMIFIAAFKLIALSISGEKRLITMTFWIFVYIFMGLVPLAHIELGYWNFIQMYSQDAVIEAYFIVFIGLLAYEVGQFADRLWRPTLGFVNRLMLTNNDLTGRRIIWFGAAAILINLISVWVTGWDSVLSLRNERVDVIAEITGEGRIDFRYGVFLFAQQMICPYTAIIMFAYYISPAGAARGIKVDSLFKIMMALVILLSMITSNPLNAGRTWIGLLLLSTLLLWAAKKPGRLSPMLSLTVILLLSVAFPLSRMARDAQTATMEVDSNFVADNLAYNIDYSQFQFIIDGAEHVRAYDVTWGRQFMGAVFSWVPRVAWPDKPNGTGALVAESKGYWITNVAMPLWGELYVDAWYFGLFFGFFLYGFIINYLERLYLSLRPGDLYLVRIFVPIYASYQFFLLRGSLMNAMLYLLPPAFILWCTMIARAPRK